MTDLNDSVLVVDDEVLISELWCMIVQDMGIEVCGTAISAEAAIATARRHRPRVVLMDVRLRGAMDGVDAAMEIHHSVGSR